MGIRVIESSNMLRFDMNDMMYINTCIGIVDKEAIKKKLERCNESADIISNGNYFRIKNFSKDNSLECWEVISKDKSEVLLAFSGLLLDNVCNFKRIKLKGLDEDGIYRNRDTNEVFSGGALMNYGVNISKLYGDYNGEVIHLKMI